MENNNELTVKQLLPQAIKVLDNSDRDHCGISWMQRMLRINFNKACDLINLLEDSGLIEAPDAIGKRNIVKR